VVFVGRGCPAGTVPGQAGDDPYLENPAGKVALIDRGDCAVSLKVDRAANAGAIGVLIGLIAPGDAVTFAYGGGTNFVPSLVITQLTSNLIKSQLGAGQVVRATLSPLNMISLAGSVVASSARGPNYSYNGIKPDIAAPGASVSAEVGTGTGQTAFGGTSGAAPMVSGAAALVLHSHPLFAPHEVKAALVNTAEPNVLTNPLTQPGVLAPITRIGGGELRVNRASAATTAAWDSSDPASPNLSYGTVRTSSPMTLTKKITVRNRLPIQRTYNISSSFRYANDAASGAVTLNVPPMLTVPGNGSGTVNVSLTINPILLPNWNLNGGSNGGNGPLLQGVEFDGFISLTEGGETIRLPWHILPHKAHNAAPSTTNLMLNGAGSGVLTLTNAGGAATALFDRFALTGTSPKFPVTLLPKPGDNFAIVDLRAVGIRVIPGGAGSGDLIQFAVTTYGERSHPNYPAEFDVFIDSNNDGVDDYVVFTAENGGLFTSGQNVTAIQNLVTGATVVRFFTSVDLWSANSILNIVAQDAGLNATSQFRFSVLAGDNYYTGVFTDVIGPMTVKLDAPRFVATPTNGAIAPNGSTNVQITHNPAGDASSPSQTGVLLLYTHGKRGREADVVTVVP
jgi:hypothetical protein